MFNLETIRAQMPVCDGWAYLDHAAVAPLPAPAAEAIRTWLDEATTVGDVAWPTWHAGVQRLRTRAARLIGAETTDVALVPNTTIGIGLIAEGFPWQPGESVVVPDNEFPSNLSPWLNLRSRGVVVRTVPTEGGVVDPDRVAEACDDTTRVVAASWVGFLSGDRLDPGTLADVAHDRGAIFLLDAIQGLGVFPIDVEATGVDVLVADGHKWMLGPEAGGVLYVRRSVRERLRKILVGWASAAGGGSFAPGELDLRDDAAVWEGGTQCQAAFLALDASLAMLEGAGLTCGASPGGEYLVELTARLVAELAARGATIVSPRRPGHESGIVTFDWPGTAPETIRQAALRAKIALSVRLGKLRVSPHIYSTEEDLARLLEVLEAHPIGPRD